jgi:hypothetical protein
MIITNAGTTGMMMLANGTGIEPMDLHLATDQDLKAELTRLGSALLALDTLRCGPPVQYAELLKAAAELAKHGSVQRLAEIRATSLSQLRTKAVALILLRADAPANDTAEDMLTRGLIREILATIDDPDGVSCEF